MVDFHSTEAHLNGRDAALILACWGTQIYWEGLGQHGLAISSEWMPSGQLEVTWPALGTVKGPLCRSHPTLKGIESLSPEAGHGFCLTSEPTGHQTSSWRQPIRWRHVLTSTSLCRIWTTKLKVESCQVFYWSSRPNPLFIIHFTRLPKSSDRLRHSLKTRFDVFTYNFPLKFA